MTTIENNYDDEIKEMAEYIEEQLDYEKEEMNDDLLREIKTICFSWLENEKSISNISDEELFIAYEFLTNVFEDVSRIRDGFKIKSYCHPFLEMAVSMDEITISSSTKHKVKEYSLVKLTKDVNYVMNEIGFCYGIINKIIKQRNLE